MASRIHEHMLFVLGNHTSGRRRDDRWLVHKDSGLRDQAIYNTWLAAQCQRCIPVYVLPMMISVVHYTSTTFRLCLDVWSATARSRRNRGKSGIMCMKNHTRLKVLANWDFGRFCVRCARILNTHFERLVRAWFDWTRRKHYLFIVFTNGVFRHTDRHWCILCLDDVLLASFRLEFIVL